MKVVAIILSFFFVTISELSAREFLSIQKSPRGILMGDAYMTLADDSYALFYNPALMGRHSGFSMYPFNPTISLINPLEYADQLEGMDEIGDEPSEIVSQFSGIPLHLGASMAPGFKLGRFGFSLVANSHTNLQVLNDTHPMLDIQHKYDRGFTMGYAAKLSNQLSLGIATKYIRRQGIDTITPVFSREVIDAIGQNPESFNDLMRGLGMDEGRAWGFDLGLDYHAKGGAGEFSMGFVVQDIVDTKFQKGNGVDADVPIQKMNMSWGASLKQDFKLIDFTLSGEISHINQRVDLKRRLHLGFEIGLPLIRVIAGYNGGYLSYGGEVDLGLIDVYVGLYEVEIGESYKQHSSKRAIIYFSLFDFHFDV
jgi:hypothetical protein